MNPLIATFFIPYYILFHFYLILFTPHHHTPHATQTPILNYILFFRYLY